MDPLIKEEDTIAFLPTDSSSPQVGQLVLAFDGTHFFSHRIIDLVNGEYVLKGDNNHYIDGFFDRKALLGIAASDDLNTSSLSDCLEEKDRFWDKITFAGESLSPALFQDLSLSHMPFHTALKVPRYSGLCIGVDRTSGTSFSQGLASHFTDLYQADSLIIDFTLDENCPHKSELYTYCWNLEGQYADCGLSQKDQCLMIAGMLSQCLSMKL